ncbi:MAG TPA: NAD-dependent malic enzyme [Candidatus Binataceae bacterium]|nr:NAD-dependent malic enzyme [Candidatus Binataceae bacterium]
MTFTRLRDERTGEQIVEVSQGGRALLDNPFVNKGVVFSEEERCELGLHGLLPARVLTAEEDVALAYEEYQQQTSDLGRYIFLSSLQDRNETLFFRLIVEHLTETTPIAYTPVVGTAVERYSHIWRRPRGIFLVPPHGERIESILRALPNREHIEAIVVTDAEAVLGIGDQGAGGIAISIGKLALYTACGGIAPEATLPVMLDVGTDNEALLGDPIYLGWRHPRLRGQAYDDFLAAFVEAVAKVFPRALLQFEDFGTLDARALLDRYREQLCTFNDDIQGTGAVTLASLIAAARITGSKLSEQDVVIFGAGSGGTGVADQIVAKTIDEGLSESEARARIWVVDRRGLMLSDMKETEFPYRRKYYQPPERVRNWRLEKKGAISLADVVRNLHPAVLIGTSAAAGAFTREIVREIAAHVKRPIVFPLSNPSTRCEAVPRDLIEWTEGRALIATGSPFPDVEYGGRRIRVSQCNNVFIFPGVALGVLASGARRITDSMFMAAASALAECSPALNDPNAPLLPSIEQVRQVSQRVAIAVGLDAQRKGLAPATTPWELEEGVTAKMWTPRYARVRLRR